MEVPTRQTLHVGDSKGLRDLNGLRVLSSLGFLWGAAEQSKLQLKDRDRGPDSLDKKDHEQTALLCISCFPVKTLFDWVHFSISVGLQTYVWSPAAKGNTQNKELQFRLVM